MSDEPINLVLDHLRALHLSVLALHEDNREMKTRLNEVYSAVVSLRRDQANDAEIVHRMQIIVDQLSERVERIEHRLDLREVYEA